MTRPICWECGNQLMYVKGAPVFETYTDELGHAHKLHKDCFKRGGYAERKVTARSNIVSHCAYLSEIARAVRR